MSKSSKDQEVSDRLPVARVAVDISLAHLDRPFDYLVPASMDATAVPGCRVRVRFAGQLVDGYLLDRAETSEHQGRLARLERVISPEPVLTPGDLRPGPCGSGPVRGHARRRAEARHPAPPRRRRTGSPQPRPRGTAKTAPRRRRHAARPEADAVPHRRQAARRLPARVPARGPVHRRRGVSGRAGRGPAGPGGRGRPCPVPDGRPRSPSLPPPRPPLGVAWSSSCRTPAIWPASTRRWPGNSGPRPRLPDRGPRPRRALPPLAGRPAGRGPGGGGHPGRDVRAGLSAGPGGALGRRRRPARRAARAVPERPRGAGPARAPGRRGRPDRRLRPDRRAHPAGRGRMGPAADRPAGGAARGRAAGPGRAR